MTDLEGALIDTLAEVTGVKDYAAKLYTQNAEGESIPVEPSKVKEIILPDYQKKIDSLTTLTDDKIKTLEQQARKEAKEAVETQMAELFELPAVSFKDQGAVKFKEDLEVKYAETSKLNPDDVTKHDKYLSLKGDLEAQKLNHTKSLAEINRQRIDDHMYFGLPSLAKNDKYKFITPSKEEILNTHLETAFTKIRANNPDVNFVFAEDGRTVIPVDQDGHRIHDKSGNPVGLDHYRVKALESVFETSANSKRGSAGAGDPGRAGGAPPPAAGSASNEIKYTDPEGQAKSYTLPSFKSKSEVSQFISDNVMSKPKEVIDAAKAIRADLEN